MTFTADEIQTLESLSNKLRTELVEKRKRLLELEAQIKADEEFYNALTKRLGGPQPAEGGDSADPSLLGRVLGACLAFKSAHYHSHIIHATLSGAGKIDADVSIEKVGNYLWRLANENKIVQVQPGAGKRPAIYRNVILPS